MLALYSPFFLLQAYCLYHAYKTKADPKWYFAIIFVPIIGVLLYLFNSYLEYEARKSIAEHMGPMPQVRSLMDRKFVLPPIDHEIDFNDTIANKTKLADKYIESKKYILAIALYESCLKGFNQDDPDILMKLLKANFLNKSYDTVIKIGNRLTSVKAFQNAIEKIAYAISLQHLGETELAEKAFQEMDVRFTNYPHRIEYGNFLLATQQIEAAKAKFATLLEEFEEMDAYEKNLKQDSFERIKSLYDKIS